MQPRLNFPTSCDIISAAKWTFRSIIYTGVINYLARIVPQLEIDSPISRIHFNNDAKVRVADHRFL